MLLYKSDNFAELYLNSLTELYTRPNYITNPRGFEIKENINVCLTLENPLSCLFKSPARSSQKKYISAELLWYFFGANDITFIKNYSTFWDQIAVNGEANSAYGHLIFNQLNQKGYSQYYWALSSLLHDKDSRQAILHFNTPQHQYGGNKDFPCTLYGIFHIRENKLHFTVHMRSNDVVWGLANDIVFFVTLQCQMLNHLRVKYPNLELGQYVHVADSFHLYERHYELVERLIKSEVTPVNLPQLGLNLVNEIGTPTKEFVGLYNNFKNDSYSSEDPLFSWIKTNLTK
jgi:thymidylate synthase